MVVEEPSRSTDSAFRGTALAYLQLFRAPNAFTAIADVAMGFLVTARSLTQWPALVLLMLSSTLLYTAGMVLNDVFDLEVDRVERPRRPLPSGKISWIWARWLGFQMLVTGLAVGWLAGFASNFLSGPPWRTGLVATLLAGSILCYDGWAKKGWFGPLVMGSCRFLNVLLGMSLAANVVTPDELHWLRFGTSHLMIAGGIGLYIVGVTWFARSETSRSPRGPLILGFLLMAAGIALLAAFPRWHLDSFRYYYEPKVTWPFALAVMSIWILRRALLAIHDPTPARVQGAVKQCILSLIVLDAFVCSLICDWPFAVGILALLAPTMLLGRWVYST